MSPFRDVLLGAHDATDLAEEPRIDRRELVEPLVGDAEAHRVRDVEEAVGRRRPDDLLERARDRSGVVHLERARGPRVELRRIHAEVARLLRLGEREVVHPSDERLEPVLPGLERARRLLDRLAERSPDAHHLADALHLRSERRLGAGELLEREPRPLRDDVVDDRLERGARTRDVVLQLVERVADGELRGDLRDRVPGGLRGERARPRDARVHLDDVDPPVLRAHGELDVRAARLDANLGHHGARGVAEALVLAVGERHRGGDRDRVARVHPHRVDVLDRADDDEVVLAGRG